MIPVSALYREASIHSHTMFSRVDAYEAGVLVQADVAITGGKIDVNRESNVRWTASVDMALNNWESLEVNPDKARLKLYRGISSIGITEMVQLGEYRIDDVSRPQRGQVTMKLSGLESYVIDARFPQPRVPPYGSSTIDAIQALLTEGVPGGVILDTRATTNRKVQQTAPWAVERMDTIVNLADTINAAVYADNRGRFVLKDKPPAVQAAVAILTTNDVVLSTDWKRDRQSAFNAVCVSSTSSDSAVPPYFGWAYDNDPLSPTYFFGPFGQKPRYYTSQFFTSSLQCANTAARMLFDQLTPRESFSLTSVPLIWLEPDDVVLVEDSATGEVFSYLIQSTSLGLGPEDAMTINTAGRQQYSVPLSLGESVSGLYPATDLYPSIAQFPAAEPEGGSVSISSSPPPSMPASPPPPDEDVQAFSTAGDAVWAKPTGKTTATVYMVGGGSSGYDDATMAPLMGGPGMGGWGGAYMVATIPLADLGATEAVYAGLGGGVAPNLSRDGEGSTFAGMFCSGGYYGGNIDGVPGEQALAEYCDLNGRDGTIYSGGVPSGQTGGSAGPAPSPPDSAPVGAGGTGGGSVGGDGGSYGGGGGGGSTTGGNGGNGIVVVISS